MKQTFQNLGLACWLVMAAAWLVIPGCANRPPQEQITDQLIDDKVTADRVKADLTSNTTYHFPKVQVTADNGTVTLSGFVDNEQEKRQAAALALSIHRVKKVENYIQLDQPTSP